MDDALGSSYAQSWASQQVVGPLGGRTVQEALDAGIPPKDGWREVWQVLGLPPSQR